MLLRHCIFCTVIISLNACDPNSATKESIKSEQATSVQSDDSDKEDTDFNSFIETFSKDTIFQLNRTKFPLRIKQYDVMNDKDTIFYKQRSAFEMMDFRKKKSDSRYDEWRQEIFLEKSQTRATIEIRGVDNGLVVDYLFEKRNGKWMYVGIDDQST